VNSSIFEVHDFSIIPKICSEISNTNGKDAIENQKVGMNIEEVLYQKQDILGFQLDSFLEKKIYHVDLLLETSKVKMAFFFTISTFNGSRERTPS